MREDSHTEVTEDTEDKRDHSLEKLVACARNNSKTCVPCLVICILGLAIIHDLGGYDGVELLFSGLIGGIIGWLAALWGTCFLLKFGSEL